MKFTIQYLFYTTFQVILIFCLNSCNSQNANTSVSRDHNNNPDTLNTLVNTTSNISFDSSAYAVFFNSRPLLNNYSDLVKTVYVKNQYHFIWFDKSGLVEFSNTLYNKLNQLSHDGVFAEFPYQSQLDGVFEEEIENKLSDVETEIMLTCLYAFYLDKVYNGLDEKITNSIGWLLPRKKIEFEHLIDSLIEPKHITTRLYNIRQYELLKEALLKYKTIEKRGGWAVIGTSNSNPNFKPGDTSYLITQIRNRLFIAGELNINSQNNTYDSELKAAILKYKKRNGFKVDSLITKNLILNMNVPVTERIKQIIVNMERARWIPLEIAKANEFIVINIPSYQLSYIKEGETQLVSPVIVGTNINKTVIFSGNMSHIVFSPYWYVPQSIINKEIKAGIAKNKNYLIQHNMEWHKGQLRQKPGKNNALGRVKFIFPNSNNIYLHDTPNKSLFEKEERAFSHGCIRVGKPKELALTILNNDPNWNASKIETAMSAGVEKSYYLKTKIPVYIGYFTAWVDNNGEINFYDDIYKRDERLFNLIMN